MNIQKHTRVVASLLFSLVGFNPVFAADTYSAAPNRDASPAPKTSTTHKKHVRKAAKPKTETTIPANPANAPGAPPDTSNKDTVIPGVSGSNMGNDAGRSNMGTGDHVPGTTGTSGQ